MYSFLGLFNENDESTPTAKAKSALIKVPFTVALVKNLFDGGDGPIVIYTDHVASCEKLAQDLGNCPFIHGGVPIKKRNEYIQRFQRDELDYIVITIGAGSEGITLTRANNLVINDQSWIPSRNEQAKKRIHRISQERTCHITNIIGSVQDKKILDTLRRKLKVIGEIV